MFQILSPNTLHLIVFSTNFIVHGAYKSIYRTTRRGKVESSLHGFSVDLRLHFAHSQSRVPYLSKMDCIPNTKSIRVELRPFLLNEVKDAVQKSLWSTVQKEVCSSAKDYIRQINENFVQLRHGLLKGQGLLAFNLINLGSISQIAK